MASFEFFINALTRSGFDTQLAAGTIPENALAFIRDTREIWAQGLFYSCDFKAPVLTAAPTAETTTYVDAEGYTRSFQVGQACIYTSTDIADGYGFAVLKAIVDGAAVWHDLSAVTSATVNTALATAKAANTKADKALSDSSVALDAVGNIQNITGADDAVAALTSYLLQISQNTEDLKHRFGYVRDIEGVRQFFATEDAASLYDEDPITNSALLLQSIKTAAEGGSGGGSSSGMYYKLRVVNGLDSRNIVASKGEPCNILFTFVSQQKETADEEYQDTGERGWCEVSVKRATDDSFMIVKEYYVQSNILQTMDVSSYLGTGSNTVRVKITGELTEQTTPAFAWTAQLTALSIDAPNFAWWSAYSDAFTIPYLIGGNTDKTLNVKVTGTNYEKDYSIALGSLVYTETAYNFACEHPGASGVYTVAASVSNSDGSITTKTLTHQIICVTSGDTNTYMAINNVASELINWSENVVCEYAVYNGSASASVSLGLEKDGVEVYTETLGSVPTATKQTFSASLEVDTLDNTDFTLSLTATGNDVALITPIEIPVDNSFGFSAVAGAVFYLNPRTRNNSETNREIIINEVDKSEVTATWTGMNWGSDGYQTVDDGKVLRLFAGTECNVNYQPLAEESARTGKTISFDFRISNTLDYDTAVTDIITKTVSSFVGVRLSPDSALVQSSAKSDADNQILYFEDDARLHLDVVIMPNAYGNSGFNLVILYVNGTKNREFTYETNDYFASSGNLRYGSEDADIDIYGTKVYNSALTSTAIQRNHENWLATIAEKEAYRNRNDVYNAEGTAVDIEKVKKRCNVVVFEGEIPSIDNPNKFTNNWYTYWRDTPEWNIIIEGISQDGQGTSSKKYRKWNQRGKVKDTTLTTYADGTTSLGAFFFVPGQPKIEKFTWKLNWASPCQCNKMGSVNSINDLCAAMDILDNLNSRVGVYQEPFVGFQLSYDDDGNAVYTFLGLFTGGPDKGDPLTMNYDTDTYPDLLSIEGADNASLGALFKVPYNPNKTYWQYHTDEESFQYNGVNAFDYNGGAAETKEDVESLFNRVWGARYNFVYTCSPNLTYWEGTIDELNTAENILLYKSVDTEFFTADGSLYYYEEAEGMFVASDIGEGAINLVTQLVDKGYGLTADMLTGKTGAEQATLFSAARIMRFNLEAGTYFHKPQSLFSITWMEMNASTDTRTKNTYFKMYGSVEDGHLCYFFWDDTDTLALFTNQGQDKKGYWVEVGDKYDNGGPVWNGEQNRFYNLVEAAYPQDIYNMMHTMLGAMEDLSDKSDGSASEKLYAFYHKYYFSKAQEYFPEALFNETAKILYEEGKVAYDNGTYVNDTDPITQSLGSYYSGWKRWIKKRIQYIQSKYSYGDYSATGGDYISVRAAGNDITYQITPAIWMYPNIANGTSIVRGPRTQPGETIEMTISLGGAADQQNDIKGANFLQSIGNWWNKNVTGAMIVKGKMLRELNIGHASEDIVISISSLTVSGCTSLQTLDVRRIATLSGVLNLNACTHIKNIYAGGTALTQIVLPDGGGLEHIQYSPANQYVTLRNFPLLTAEGVDISECATVVTDFFVTDCESLSPIGLLLDIITAQADQTDHSLKRIRMTGINHEDTDGTIFNMLYQLRDGTYAGLNADGLAGSDVPLPVLEGYVRVIASVDQDQAAEIQAAFPSLELDLMGDKYIEFEDPIIASYAASTWGDGVGLTYANAAKVTSINSSAFRNQTELLSFEEIGYFKSLQYVGTWAFEGTPVAFDVSLLSKTLTNVDSFAFEGTNIYGYVDLPNITRYGANVFANTKIEGVLSLGSDSLTFIEASLFNGCSNFKSICPLPNIVKINAYSFFNTALETIDIPNVEFIGEGAFENCANLVALNWNPEKVVTLHKRVFFKAVNLNFDNLELPNLSGSLDASLFSGPKIKRITNLGLITSFNGYCGYEKDGWMPWGNYEELLSVTFPSTLTELLYSGLTYTGRYPNLQYVAFESTTPPTLSSGFFNNSTFPIYVPDDYVETYKTTTNWSTYASRILPISEKPTE